jgi:GNAT superfamily N-acetyltransferase
MGDVTEPRHQGRGSPITPPAPIESGHIIDNFDCGTIVLNDWLQNRAKQSEAKSSRTFVVCSGTTVVGYYCLSAGGVLRDEVPTKLRRNMPGSVPVMILGRLAVDAAYQGRNIGSDLLLDAMKRTIGVSKETGVRAMLVHVIDDETVPFYLQYGFVQFPEGSKTLFLPIETMIDALRKSTDA